MISKSKFIALTALASAIPGAIVGVVLVTRKSELQKLSEQLESAQREYFGALHNATCREPACNGKPLPDH